MAAVDDLDRLVEKRGLRAHNLDALHAMPPGETDSQMMLNGYIDSVLEISMALEEAGTASGFAHGEYDDLVELVDRPRPLPAGEAQPDPDRLEALKWRRGAARYAAASMWINAAHGSSEVTRCVSALSTSPKLADALEQGEHALQALLADSAGRFDADDVVGNHGSAELLRLGIRSDAHVLACMYAAEMAYWRACSHGDLRSPAAARWLDVAVRHASLYIRIARNLLPAPAGWDCRRAEEIIEASSSRSTPTATAP